MSCARTGLLMGLVAASLAILHISALWADELPVAKALSGDATQPLSHVTDVLTLTPQLDLPDPSGGKHILAGVIRKMWSGEFGDQPEWRLALLIQGLQHEPTTAKVTAYSTRCPDGAGPRTRWGTRVRRGICAADPRYWGPGSVVWVDAPLYNILIVEDTGSAIKGPHRFDVSFADDAAACRRFGVRKLTYVALHAVPPRRSWGTRPSSWTPPAPPLRQVLKCRRDPHGTVLKTESETS